MVLAPFPITLNPFLPFRWPRLLSITFSLTVLLALFHLFTQSYHTLSSGQQLHLQHLVTTSTASVVVSGALYANDPPTYPTPVFEPVLHFSPLTSANPTPLPFNITLGNFTGTRSLHMSSHHCVGVYGGPEAGQLKGLAVCNYTNFFCTDPLGLYPNRTCKFTNLYFARINSHPPPYSSYDWFYFASVTSAEVKGGAWDADVARTYLQAQFRTAIHSRIHQDNWWRLWVVFFLEEPVAGGEQPLVSLTRPFHTPLKPGGVVAGNAPAGTVSGASECTLLETISKQGGGGSSTTLPYKGNTISCLPPGVGAFTLRHFFLLHMTHHTNICHTLWDDLVPFAAVAQLLGLPLTQTPLPNQPPPLDFLLTCRPQERMFRWDRMKPFGAWGMGDMGVRQAFAYASPGKDPVQLGDVLAEAGDRLVHFPLVGGGLTAMSAHNFRPSYAVFGAEAPLRSVWALRTHLMQSMGFTEAEVERSVGALPPPSPTHTLSLLIVKGKRGIRNLEGLMGGIRKAYPFVKVSTVAWEEVGGLAKEARLLSTTHVVVSLDGTVASKNLFLPPGAVFINLGVAQEYGSQYFLDFLHGAYDHIRVLSYDKLADGEHEGHMLSSMTVPLEKLAPYLEEAFALVAPTGPLFSIPVEASEELNLDANARLLRFLFNRYPEFPYAGIAVWHNASVRSKRVFVAAEEMYALATGKSAPKSLREDIVAYCATHPCDKRGR